MSSGSVERVVVEAADEASDDLCIRVDYAGMVTVVDGISEPFDVVGDAFVAALS